MLPGRHQGDYDYRGLSCNGDEYCRNIVSNRSWTRNIFQILNTPNPTVKWVIGGAILFPALVLNIPFLTEIFLFQKVDLLEISICTAAGLLSITGFEIFKLAANRSKRELC